MFSRTYILLAVLLCGILIGAYALYVYITPPPKSGRFDPVAASVREVLGKNLKELTDEQLIYVDAQGKKWTAPKGT